MLHFVLFAHILRDIPGMKALQILRHPARLGTGIQVIAQISNRLQAVQDSGLKYRKADCGKKAAPLGIGAVVIIAPQCDAAQRPFRL